MEEIVKLTLDNVTTQVDVTLPIGYDYFSKNHRNRYKKPSENLVWRMDAKLESSKPVVELIYPNQYVIGDYIVSYLKYPTDLSVVIGGVSNSCEIPDKSFNDEIVGEAIKIITASLNEEGYQVVAAEKKFDEN
jgi:hypothetical protein